MPIAGKPGVTDGKWVGWITPVESGCGGRVAEVAGVIAA